MCMCAFACMCTDGNWEKSVFSSIDIIRQFNTEPANFVSIFMCSLSTSRFH